MVVILLYKMQGLCLHLVECNLFLCASLNNNVSHYQDKCYLHTHQMTLENI